MEYGECRAQRLCKCWTGLGIDLGIWSRARRSRSTHLVPDRLAQTFRASCWTRPIVFKGQSSMPANVTVPMGDGQFHPTGSDTIPYEHSSAQP
jgi:hypothetical protein